MNIRFGFTTIVVKLNNTRGITAPSNFDASFLNWASLCAYELTSMHRVSHTDEAACGPNRLTKLFCGGVLLLTLDDTLMGGGDRKAHHPSRRWVGSTISTISKNTDSTGADLLRSRRDCALWGA